MNTTVRDATLLSEFVYLIFVNSQLEAILAAHALNLGRSWWTVASQIATLANFYLTTWEEYHTGLSLIICGA